MRRYAVGLVAGTFLLMLAVPGVAVAQDGYLGGQSRVDSRTVDSYDGPMPVRVRHFEGAVTVQRAHAGETGEAMVNLPLEPGDRVWTRDDGRLELVLPDGSLAWLDRRTTLDVVSAPRGQAQETILRLWGGSMILARQEAAGRVRLDLPDASVVLSDEVLVRIDAGTERSWVSVYDGQAVLAAGGLTEPLYAGERSFVEPGTAPAEATAFNTAEVDGFDRWYSGRVAELSRVVNHVRERSYVPREIVHYAADLEPHGSWFYYDDFDSWAWRPSLSVSFSPYRHGRWIYGYAGWTWVPQYRWGWVTSHYGRWHHVPAYGWVWFPGRAYAPAWVSWYVTGSHIGWSPLGFYDRPLLSVNLWLGGHRGYGFGYHGRSGGHGFSRGRAVPRGKVVAGRGYVDGPDDAWTFVSSDSLGRGVGRNVVDRTAVRRGGQNSAVAFQGRLRPRDPRDLATSTGTRPAIGRGGYSAGGDGGRAPASPRSAVTRDTATPTRIVVPDSGGRQTGASGRVVRPRPGGAAGGSGSDAVRPVATRPAPDSASRGRAIVRPSTGWLRPGGTRSESSSTNRTVVPRASGSIRGPEIVRPRPTVTPRPRPGSLGSSSGTSLGSRSRAIPRSGLGRIPSLPPRSLSPLPGGRTVTPRGFSRSGTIRSPGWPSSFGRRSPTRSRGPVIRSGGSSRSSSSRGKARSRKPAKPRER